MMHVWDKAGGILAPAVRVATETDSKELPCFGRWVAPDALGLSQVVVFVSDKVQHVVILFLFICRGKENVLV